MDLAATKSGLVALKPDTVTEEDSFYDLFPKLSSILVSSDAIDQHTTLTVDTLTVWLTRATQIYKRGGGKSAEELLDQYSSQLVNVFEYICEVFNAGSGPFASAVTGLLTKLLVFANTLSSAAENDTVTSQWIEILRKVPPNQKRFFSIAERLIKEMKNAARIFSKNTQFPDCCLTAMSSEAIANASSKAFTAYYSRLFDPKDSVAYVTAWSDSVNAYMLDPTYTSNILSVLLPTIFTNCPPAFETWMATIRSNSSITMDTLLPILKMGYALSTKNDPLALGLISVETLEDLLTHENRSYRENAFSIICQGLGSKTAPRPELMRLVSNDSTLSVFFQESNSPDARGVFFSTLRKALINVKDYYFTQKRRSKKQPKTSNKAELQTITVFVQDIYNFAVGQLIPDSSYHQLILAADLICFLIEFGSDGQLTKIDRLPASHIIDIYSSSFVARILRMTTNNYEDVRARCFQILLNCPYDFIVPLINQSCLDNSILMLSSLKGRQSDAMAQLMSCLAQIYQTNDRPKYLDLIRRLAGDIEVLPSKGLSVHGHFTALANIFSSTDRFLMSEQISFFESIVSSLLSTVKQFWEGIKPSMVSSPKESSEVSDSIESSDWRVIRESSYLIKTLIDVNRRHDWSLFDHESFLSICDLLMDQLVEISHRGAFSAVSPTFIKACEICFASELEQKPLEWLEQNLDLLEKKEQLISRRSAGIPLLFTSILSAASKNKDRLSIYLEITFTRLFEIGSIAYSVVGDETKDLPQVHAFNCLKCIFRERTLSSGYHSYINEALKLSLTNINHPSWAIKNGALMLFTALQECLFGSESSDKIFNRANAASFFKEYPGISSPLLSALRSPDASNANAIIPVLTILSRLAVFSPSDNSLEEFQNVMEESLLGHHSWKIREMSARVMCNVLPPETHVEHAFRILMKSAVSKNRLHGQLMAVKELVKTRSSDKNLRECLEAASSQFQSHLEQQNPNWVLARAYLEILEDESFHASALQALLTVTSREINGINHNNGQLRIFLQEAVAPILKGTQDQVALKNFTLECFKAPFYEVQEAAAKFWIPKCRAFSSMDQSLHSAVFGVISDKSTWNHTKALFLELAADARLVAEEPVVPQSNWTKEMVLASFGMRGVHNEINQVPFVIACCQDSEPEEVRLAATISARRLLDQYKGSKNHTNLLLEIWRRHSDESGEVRNAAIMDDKCSVGSSRLLMSQLAKQEKAFLWDALMPFFDSCISANLKNAVAEKQNPLFEEERDNLFRNEVDTYKSLLRTVIGLPEFLTDGESLVARLHTEVEMLVEFVEQNTDLLQVWLYNVHIDTAIRIALSLKILHSSIIDHKIDRLEQLLRDFNYS